MRGWAHCRARSGVLLGVRERRLEASMNQQRGFMDFRITGLPADQFAELQRATDDELRRRAVERRIVDRSYSPPCRISLQDADVGEEVLLFNYRHQAVASPYAASGPIFIRRSATQTFDAINVVPDQQRRRLLSVRAYDARDYMVDADVAPGTELETLVRRFFANQRVAYLHLHNARHGCYSCRVDRA
jgi:Protein of unknown function (DUF1203)